MFRRICFSALNKRNFSTNSPKTLLAKNLLILKKVGEAKNEEELSKALNSEVSIDLSNLPEELNELKPLLSISGGKSSEDFIPDPSAWQNMSFLDFVIKESSRAETWPFIVGIIITYLLLGVGLSASLPQEKRGESKYIQLLEGKAFNQDHTHHEKVAHH